MGIGGKKMRLSELQDNNKEDKKLGLAGMLENKEKHQAGTLLPRPFIRLISHLLRTDK